MKGSSGASQPSRHSRCARARLCVLSGALLCLSVCPYRTLQQADLTLWLPQKTLPAEAYLTASEDKTLRLWSADGHTLLDKATLKAPARCVGLLRFVVSWLFGAFESNGLLQAQGSAPPPSPSMLLAQVRWCLSRRQAHCRGHDQRPMAAVCCWRWYWAAACRATRPRKQHSGKGEEGQNRFSSIAGGANFCFSLPRSSSLAPTATTWPWLLTTNSSIFTSTFFLQMEGDGPLRFAFSHFHRLFQPGALREPTVSTTTDPTCYTSAP